MSIVLPDPLGIPDLVFVPQNETSFLKAVEEAANERQKRLLVVDIKKSVASIRHKLNIVMYQTALICKINTQDFQDFKSFADNNQHPSKKSHVEYKGCSYDMEDLQHYRFIVGFFVETFAAASFSLLDVCGRLLNDLYALGRKETETSFKVAYKDLIKEKNKQNNPDAVFQFITKYYLAKQVDDRSSDMPAWLPPLEEIRHRTTHRPITDVCVIRSYSSLYPEIDGSETAFFLNRDLFASSSGEVLLRDFVQQAFRGMQEFVEELYDLLRQSVEQNGSLELS